MARNLEDLLATLPEHELAQMQTRARGDVALAQDALKRAEVELDLIDRAVARQTRRAGIGNAPSGATRDAVSAAVIAGGALTPAEVIATVRGNGLPVKDGAIRAMIRRLADEGVIVKLANGRYSQPPDATDFASAFDAGDDAGYAPTSPNGDDPEGEDREPSSYRAGSREGPE